LTTNWSFFEAGCDSQRGDRRGNIDLDVFSSALDIDENLGGFEIPSRSFFKRRSPLKKISSGFLAGSRRCQTC